MNAMLCAWHSSIFAAFVRQALSTSALSRCRATAQGHALLGEQASSAVLKRLSAGLLQQAVEQYDHTAQPQHLFTGFFYQAGTWPEPRWVVVKCEANARGTNRRAVVTNRPGARVVPQGAYEEYAERGESENRNKELKCELCTDRLSDHRYMANCFRMFLHCAAANLLVHMRRQIAAPPVEPATQVLLEMQREPTSSVKEEVPSEPTSEVLVDPGQNNSARVSHEVPAEASSAANNSTAVVKRIRWAKVTLALGG